MKNLSKFWIGLIVGVLVTSLLLPSSVFAGQAIKLVINGTEIKCDVPPQNINGRVLVPARFVAEALGATVEWDGENQAVIVKSASASNPVKPAPIQDKITVDENGVTLINGYPDRNNNGLPDWAEHDDTHRMPTQEEAEAMEKANQIQR